MRVFSEGESESIYNDVYIAMISKNKQCQLNLARCANYLKMIERQIFEEDIDMVTLIYPAENLDKAIKFSKEKTESFDPNKNFFLIFKVELKSIDELKEYLKSHDSLSSVVTAVFDSKGNEFNLVNGHVQTGPQQKGPPK